MTGVGVCSEHIVNIYFVKTLEDEFWEKYGLMEEVMDSFIISVGRRDSSKNSKSPVVNLAEPTQNAFGKQVSSSVHHSLEATDI